MAITLGVCGTLGHTAGRRRLVRPFKVSTGTRAADQTIMNQPAKDEFSEPSRWARSSPSKGPKR